MTRKTFEKQTEISREPQTTLPLYDVEEVELLFISQ